jgi:hypothetical protein
MSKPNLRTRIRAPFETDVSFVVNEQAVSGFVSHDVSMNGIFLATQHPLPLGSIGQLTITLFSGKEQTLVKTLAEVVRVAESDEPQSGMGLIFVDLDPDSSIALYNIVKYHTQANG